MNSRSLFDLHEQTSLGSSSKWCDEARRPSSCLMAVFAELHCLNSFYSGLLKEDYKPDPRILCQLGLIYLWNTSKRN